MRNLLTPITIIIWYLTTYYGLYYSIVLLMWMFSINWIWLIFIYPILIGIIFAITNGIPSLLRIYILKFYNYNWFAIIIHSLFGLLGVVVLFLQFYNNPIVLVSNGQETSMLKAMWSESAIKTIILIIPFIGVFISLIWATIFYPIYLKITNRDVKDNF